MECYAQTKRKNTPDGSQSITRDPSVTVGRTLQVVICDTRINARDHHEKWIRNGREWEANEEMGGDQRVGGPGRETRWDSIAPNVWECGGKFWQV